VTVPVLTAVSDAVWEAELVVALERSDLGVAVVRRCVDLADLLATATTGQARAVLLSADLRRPRPGCASPGWAPPGVAVVGLAPPGDEEAERRLRALGVRHVLPSDTSPEQLADAVVQAVGAPAEPTAGAVAAHADPRAALATAAPVEQPLTTAALGTGHVVAVWGPTGAPGRTTVAVHLAGELAGLGRSTLLVDADVYGGVVAQVLGLLDEAPGLAAASRLANQGALDLHRLAGLARTVAPQLRVLSGVARADRWPELRPASLEVVLELARSLATTTVVDCSFALEQDEELAYDTPAPRRNGATLTGAGRGRHGARGRHRRPGGPAAARARARRAQGGGAGRRAGRRRQPPAGPPPSPATRRARSGGSPVALRGRRAGAASCRSTSPASTGVAGGRTLAEAAPTSPARTALTALAAELAGVPAPPPRRRLALSRR
jgi:hypothetical protein